MEDFVENIVRGTMKLNKRKLSFILTLMLCFIILPISSLASGSTISVKLSNNIGNKSSISFETIGNYKLANGNVRLSGKDRFEVANNVASSGWSTSETVIVVNYVAFADALAAAPLAYKYNAPILLTQANKLTEATRLKIQALKPKNIIIVGGTGSVSLSVSKELHALASSVSRIGGSDRFEVATNIAEQLGGSDTAIITNGLVFADALSIAPYAARKGYPILLTTSNNLPNSTKEALKGKRNALIIGGVGSVSLSVSSQLPSPSRIGGRDRYEVSANIIRQLNLDATNAFLSTGATFADALTGSVLAAKQNAPMLLTIPTRLPDSIKSIINDKGINSFTVLGGTGSVSNTVVSSLPNEVWITPSANYSVRVQDGRLALYKGNDRVKDFGNSSFTLVPSVYGSQAQIRLDNKVNYLGKMQFNIENGSYVRPVNRDIPFEDYLKGVVPREMPASWNLEALKAQAVAARTYSIDDIGEVVPDTQSYQVYGGFTWGSGVAPYQYEWRTNQAVEQTAGQVLRYNGKLITAVFSSSNGGHTESNSNEWGSSQLPYLPAKPDPYDPQASWNIKITKKQIDMTGKSLENPGHWWWSVTEANSTYMNGLKNWLRNNGHPNSEIKIIAINDFKLNPERTSGGRAVSATINAEYYVKDSNGFVCEPGPCNDQISKIKKFTLNKTLPVSTFRTIFGGMEFKSTLVDFAGTNPENSNEIKILGRGFGHGVGMSQHGANSMGAQGKNYKQILTFYYPGSTLGK